MAKRTITVDELISEMTEIMYQTEGEYLEEVANQVMGGKVTYLEDSMFEVET